MNYNKEDDNKNAPKKGGSFFQNIIEALFNSHSPEAEKKRRLKAIAKDLAKSKYHSFYRPQSGEMLPSFAKLFYDIYKIIFSAQNFIRGIPNQNSIKLKIINFSLSEKQIEVLEHLDENKIIEMSKKIPIENIRSQIESDLDVLNSDFDSERVTRIENCYKAYKAFSDFCSFDFYFMLKKFASSFQEGNFAATPNFDKTSAEYIVEELQDLITLIYSIPDGIAWDDFFELLKEMKGSELISANTWRKIVQRLKSIQSSHALEYICRLILQKPDFAPTVSHTTETILDVYMDKIHEEVENAISKIESQQKASKTNDICMKIFGKTTIDQLTNYVNSFNGVLEKKELTTYQFCDGLNYLKEFILNFIKSDVREYTDIVVIRGQWDATLSAPISNGYQELLSISDQITSFDLSLAEEGTIGMKIKTLLPKIAHDPGAENIINRLVNDANETAKGFLVTATQDLIQIGKLLKQVIEDEQKPKHVLIQNWKELERFSDKPLLKFGIDIYKKIYLFVQLMQSSLSNIQ
ncbi:MAG: DUF5312 family protein [Treponema sp.]|nr:DUF5312 family protein [Treponema sp.]